LDCHCEKRRPPHDPAARARRAGRGSGHAAQLALAALLAAALLPAGLQSTHVGGAPRGWIVALDVALLALHVCVATARRWPKQSFTIGTVACAILLVAPDIDGVTDFADSSGYSPILLPSTLCFFALLYAVSAHTTAPWPNAALGVGLAGGCLTPARLRAFTGTPIDAWAWWLLLCSTVFGGTVAAWALGRCRDGEPRRGRRLVTPGSPERAQEILTTIAEAGREALIEMRGHLGNQPDSPVVVTELDPGLDPTVGQRGEQDLAAGASRSGGRPTGHLRHRVMSA
jgi:hypothetical protein